VEHDLHHVRHRGVEHQRLGWRDVQVTREPDSEVGDDRHGGEQRRERRQPAHAAPVHRRHEDLEPTARAQQRQADRPDSGDQQRRRQRVEATGVGFEQRAVRSRQHPDRCHGHQRQ
jgi:hypothetical protein